jgi:hypothetical protein
LSENATFQIRGRDQISFFNRGGGCKWEIGNVC